MTDSRLLQLQARLLEDEQLTGSEQLELEQARRGSDPMARLLQEDEALHVELQALHRIDVTAGDFVGRCLLATRTSVTTEKLNLVPADAAFMPPIVIAAPRLELGDGTDRLRRLRKARRPASARRIAGWLSAAAAVMFVTVGAWWWSSHSADLPAIVAQTAGVDKVETVSRPGVETVIEPKKNKSVDQADNNVVLPQPETPLPPAPEVTALAPDPKSFIPDQPAAARKASLQFSPDSVWGQKPVEAGTFPATYGLQSGVAELVLADGTRLVFQGPADFTMESPRQLRLEMGQFRIEPVASEKSFLVATPTVWLRGNNKHGSNDLLAYLSVRPAAGTMVQVERGELSARPWTTDNESELVLSEDTLDRGIFGPAWNMDSTQPATAIAVNDDGEFNGIVNAADRPLSVTSPVVFARIVDESRDLIRENGQGFPEQWRGMVDGLEKAVASMNLQFDDRSVRPGTAGEMLDQFERIRQQMMSDMQGSGGDGGEETKQTSGFSGVINLNGREQRFSSPAEFRAAQSQMLGPMVGQMMFGKPTNSPAQLPSAIQNMIPGNMPGNGNSSSSFSGMININGRAMEFTSPEEFNRAMQQFNRR